MPGPVCARGAAQVQACNNREQQTAARHGRCLHPSASLLRQHAGAASSNARRTPLANAAAACACASSALLLPHPPPPACCWQAQAQVGRRPDAAPRRWLQMERRAPGDAGQRSAAERWQAGRQARALVGKLPQSCNRCLLVAGTHRHGSPMLAFSNESSSAAVSPLPPPSSARSCAAAPGSHTAARRA